jgi:hypothetical protein
MTFSNCQEQAGSAGAFISGLYVPTIEILVFTRRSMLKKAANFFSWSPTYLVL